MKKIPKEAIAVLREAGDQMSNNGCNDFCLPDTPTNRKFITTMMEAVADDEDYDISEHISKGQIWTTDWMLLDYIADLIEESIQ